MSEEERERVLIFMAYEPVNEKFSEEICAIITEGFANYNYLNLVYAIGYSLVYILPLIFILSYNGKKGTTSKNTKYLFYIFYPVHLLVFDLIMLLTGTF